MHDRDEKMRHVRVKLTYELGNDVKTLLMFVQSGEDLERITEGCVAAGLLNKKERSASAAQRQRKLVSILHELGVSTSGGIHTRKRSGSSTRRRRS